MVLTSYFPLPEGLADAIARSAGKIPPEGAALEARAAEPVCALQNLDTLILSHFLIIARENW